MKLTIKQEKFCMVYIETGNASEAYRQSYNCENMKPESINNKAYELLKKVEIGARLDELRGEHAKRHNLTIDDLITELEEARQAALSAMVVQSSASVAATMSKAKLLGFLDKKEEDKSSDLVETLNKLIDKMPN
jgi:phage terminase small subunit